MSVEIRSARREDEARCLEMVSALTGESASPGWAVTFQALLSRARGEILVADEAGLIVGVATVLDDPDRRRRALVELNDRVAVFGGHPCPRGGNGRDSEHRSIDQPAWLRRRGRSQREAGRSAR